MASKSSSPVTTLYQCSECKYCSQNLEEATLHAVQVHGEVEDDYQEESEEELSKIQIKEDKELVLSDEECSSLSFFKQTNGSLDGKEGNQRKTDSWSSEATKLLIECVHENYSNLKNKKVKRKTIWEQIHASLEDRVPDLTPLKCEQKWKSLLGAQKRYNSNLNKSYGKSKLKKPEFYEEVSEVIGENLAEGNVDDDDGDSSERSYKVNAPETKGKRGVLNSYAIPSDDLNAESLLDSLSQSNLQGSDTVHLLSRLVTALERREAANERFQREVLEIEKEKLRCVQRFIEGREKYNAKRYQMMKEWMILQCRTKRKREDED